MNCRVIEKSWHVLQKKIKWVCTTFPSILILFVLKKKSISFSNRIIFSTFYNNIYLYGWLMVIKCFTIVHSNIKWFFGTVFEPKSIRLQMVFEKWIMLKMFLAALSSSKYECYITSSICFLMVNSIDCHLCTISIVALQGRWSTGSFVSHRIQRIWTNDFMHDKNSYDNKRIHIV